jgi:regulatory protein
MSSSKPGGDGPRLLRRATTDSLRLLRYRMRSEHEFIDRLRRKGYTPAVIASVLARLRVWNYLDDAAFAKWWTEQRLKTGRAYGRIRYELRQKGITDVMIQATFNAFRAIYDESDQAAQLAQRRLSRWQGLARPVARRRLAGYLSRRGFSSETIGSVLQSLLHTP